MKAFDNYRKSPQNTNKTFSYYKNKYSKEVQWFAEDVFNSRFIKKQKEGLAKGLSLNKKL